MGDDGKVLSRILGKKLKVHEDDYEEEVINLTQPSQGTEDTPQEEKPIVDNDKEKPKEQIENQANQKQTDSKAQKGEENIEEVSNMEEKDKKLDNNEFLDGDEDTNGVGDLQLDDLFVEFHNDEDHHDKFGFEPFAPESHPKTNDEMVINQPEEVIEVKPIEEEQNLKLSFDNPVIQEDVEIKLDKRGAIIMDDNELIPDMPDKNEEQIMGTSGFEEALGADSNPDDKLPDFEYSFDDEQTQKPNEIKLVDDGIGEEEDDDEDDDYEDELIIPKNPPANPVVETPENIIEPQEVKEEPIITEPIVIEESVKDADEFIVPIQQQKPIQEADDDLIVPIPIETKEENNVIAQEQQEPSNQNEQVVKEAENVIEPIERPQEVIDGAIEQPQQVIEAIIEQPQEIIEEVAAPESAQEVNEEERTITDLIISYNSLQAMSDELHAFLAHNIKLLTKERIGVCLDEALITLEEYKDFFADKLPDDRKAEIYQKVRELEMQYIFETFDLGFEVSELTRKKLSVDGKNLKNIGLLKDNSKVDIFDETGNVVSTEISKGEYSFILCDKLDLNIEDYLEEIKVAKLNCEGVLLAVLEGTVVEEEAVKDAARYGARIIQLNMPISTINKNLEKIKQRVIL